MQQSSLPFFEPETKPLPSFKNKGSNKKKFNSIAKLGKQFNKETVYFTNTDLWVYPNRTKPKKVNKEARTDKLKNSAQPLETVIQGATRLEKKIESHTEKAFNLYKNLTNWIKDSIKHLIAAVKEILGIDDDYKTNEFKEKVNPQAKDQKEKIDVEKLREDAEYKQEQFELEERKSETLIEIRDILKEILEKGGMGGGGGGSGWLDTLVDLLTLRALTKGAAGGSGKLGRFLKTASKGGLTKLLAARGGGNIVTRGLARTSDKVAKTVSSAVSGTKNVAKSAMGGVTKSLGFGTKLGAGAAGGMGAAALADDATRGAAKLGAEGAEAAAKGTSKLVNIPGQGYVLQPSTPATSAASAAAPAAATSAAPAAQAAAKPAGGSWLSRMISKVTNLNPIKSIKNLISQGGPKILKAFTKIPIIGTLLETYFASNDIEEIRNDPEKDVKDKKAAIGKRIGEGVGGVIGGAVAASIPAVASATGIPGFLLSAAAYTLGDTIGRQLTGWAVDAVGGGETMYNLFESIGILRPLDEEQQEKQQQEGQIPETKGQPVPLEQAIKPEPTPVAQDYNKTLPQTMGSTKTVASSVSAPALSAVPQNYTQELETQTIRTINNKVQDNVQQMSSAKSTTPVVNNVYNNYTNQSGYKMPWSTPNTSSGAAVPPDESGMAYVLCREAGRAAGTGGVTG